MKMKEDDRFIPFFEAYKDDFFESMEDVRMYLKNNNLEYKNTQQKLHNILDNNINIQKIFDETDIQNGLSKEEGKMLSKIIILNYKLHKNHYFLHLILLLSRYIILYLFKYI